MTEPTPCLRNVALGLLLLIVALQCAVLAPIALFFGTRLIGAGEQGRTDVLLLVVSLPAIVLAISAGCLAIIGTILCFWVPAESRARSFLLISVILFPPALGLSIFTILVPGADNDGMAYFLGVILRICCLAPFVFHMFLLRKLARYCQDVNNSTAARSYHAWWFAALSLLGSGLLIPVLLPDIAGKWFDFLVLKLVHTVQPSPALLPLAMVLGFLFVSPLLLGLIAYNHVLYRTRSEICQCLD